MIPRTKTKKNLFLLQVLSITLLSLIGFFIIYITGGTQSAWPQYTYIIIILSAYFFGKYGVIIISIIVGILMGPFMPLDTFNNVMQSPLNWIARLFAYMIIGVLVAKLLERNKKYLNIIKENYLKNHLTDLYNSNKLFLDLEELNKKHKDYQLVCIKLINLEEISKYYDFEIISIINNYVINLIKKFNNLISIYSISQNELIVSLNTENIDSTMNQLKNFLNHFEQSIQVKGYNFKLNLKIGLLQSQNDNNEEAINTFNKVRIATDQGNVLESGIYLFDDSFAKERKLYNEISSSIASAISEDKLYLVYQPIIDINKNIITSCEILVRWDREGKEPIGPSLFVKIAEDIGLIQNLTKWVSEKAMINYEKWVKNGCDIYHSINITANEILDDSLRQWAMDLFNKYGKQYKGFGLEITERKLSANNVKLKQLLYRLQEIGFIIEIDDFGTGYNSLMYLEEIPSDVIKIDKYFIDKIYKEEMQIILKNIITTAHKLNSIVIAEGVEEKKQLEILKEIGCDKIQGYYFSKPLKSDDFLEYYKNFDISNYI